jgi:hypothetical protein
MRGNYFAERLGNFFHPSSRVLVGFHRLGIFLAAPLLAGAVVLATMQWLNPTGPLATVLPKGTLGYGFGQDDLDNATQQILDEQRREGYDVPSGLMLLGLPLEKVKFRNADWTKCQLPDGRVIGIASTNSKFSDVVRKFLLSEKRAGHNFTEADEPISIDGVQIALLDSDWTPITPPWLHKQRDWTWSLVALCFAFGVYFVLRSLGWVIDGFVKKPS